MDAWVAPTFLWLWIMLQWTQMCMYLFESVLLFLWGNISRNTIDESYGSSVFNFSYHFSQQLHISHLSTNNAQVSISPHPCQHLLFSFPLPFSFPSSLPLFFLSLSSLLLLPLSFLCLSFLHLPSFLHPFLTFCNSHPDGCEVFSLWFWFAFP